MRLFVAVRLPESVQRRLDLVRQSVPPYAGFKWTKAQNLHITLKFLGEVEEHRIEPIKQTLEHAVSGLHPFSIRISGLGRFNSGGRMNVLWAGLSIGTEEMSRLATAVQRGLRDVGFLPEKRPFSSHVTLLRVRQGSAVDIWRETERFRQQDFGVCSVDSIALMNSDLRPSGPVYTALARLGLGPA